MDRRRFVLSSAALGSLAAAPWVRAQQPKAVPRVAVLMFGSPGNFRRRQESFVRAMSDLGYAENRAIRYEWISANGQQDLLDRRASEIAKAKFDVIVSASTRTTQALVGKVRTTPIVMVTVEDPVLSGFVRDLERPEGNVTGLTTSQCEDLPHMLELLTAAVRGLGKAAAMLNPASATYETCKSRIETAARASHLRLTLFQASRPAEIERAVGGAAYDRAGGMVVTSDTAFYNERVYVSELASRLRLPAIYPLQGYVEAGGLMSYGANPEHNFVRAASFVDRILKGAQPAELPVEAVARRDFVINHFAARMIGFEFPRELRERATRAIG